MTICDLCRLHVSVRNQFLGEAKILALTNLTRGILQTMTLDDIAQVYNKAKEGIMVCRDCLELCRRGDCAPHDRSNIPAYNHRIIEDDITMKALVEELDRRINVKRLHEDLAKYK